jgi:hypothetical protein
MKKLSLFVIGLYLGILAAFSQESVKPDSPYKVRKLTFEEANIVSSYYSQDGNNAAVTGGIGSEKLNDISTTLDLKMYKYDKRSRKHVFTGELGIDHYTSASSDKIDPSTLLRPLMQTTGYILLLDGKCKMKSKPGRLVLAFLFQTNLITIPSG